MGGQSFKCPECGKWFLEPKALVNHAKDAHKLGNVSLVGTGPGTRFTPTTGDRLHHLK